MPVIPGFAASSLSRVARSHGDSLPTAHVSPSPSVPLTRTSPTPSRRVAATHHTATHLSRYASDENLRGHWHGSDNTANSAGHLGGWEAGAGSGAPRWSSEQEIPQRPDSTPPSTSQIDTTELTQNPMHTYDQSTLLRDTDTYLTLGYPHPRGASHRDSDSQGDRGRLGGGHTYSAIHKSLSNPHSLHSVPDSTTAPLGHHRTERLGYSPYSHDTYSQVSNSRVPGYSDRDIGHSALPEYSVYSRPYDNSNYGGTGSMATAASDGLDLNHWLRRHQENLRRQQYEMSQVHSPGGETLLLVTT